MANDRMFLRCPRCGEQLYMAKRMGNGWYTPSVNLDIVPGIDAFLKKHFACELSGDPYAFELYDEGGPMKFRPTVEA